MSALEQPSQENLQSVKVSPTTRAPSSWKKKIIIGLIIVMVVVFSTILTLTIGAPPVVWTTTSSTNCSSQGIGNTMVEVNGSAYVLFGSDSTFKRYDLTTGDCDSSNLASFPNTSGNGIALEKLDNNTILAIGGINSVGGNAVHLYSIPNNIWITFNRAKASDSDTAEPISQSSSISQGNGNSIVEANGELYMFIGGSTAFHKYTPGSNSFTSLTALPSITVTSGAALAYPGSGDFLYAFQGGSTNFFKYCMTGAGCTANTWTSLTAAPAIVNAGGSLAFVGTNDLYALGGGGTQYFWRYNVGSNSWTNLTSTNPPPDIVYGGGALTAIGTDLYAFQGSNTKAFWKYNTLTGVWSSLASAPDRVSAGAALTNDGTNIYATRGKNTKEFWKYTVASDSWSILKDAPLGIGTNASSTFTNTAKGGIAYMSVGPSGGGEIFMVSGNGVSASAGLLFRYKIATNTWPMYEVPASGPGTFTYGASLVYPGSGDYAYALLGGGTKNFWKYVLSQNMWVPWNRGKLNATDPISQNVPILTTQTIGSEITEIGGKLYISNGNQLQSFDPSSNVWKAIPFAPKSLNTGSVDSAIAKYDNTSMYVLGGSNSFWKYDVANEAWLGAFKLGKTPTGKPISQLASDDGMNTGSSNLDQGEGSTFTEANGKLYVLAGGSTQTFLRYDPSANLWLQLANAPAAVRNGAAIVKTDNNTLYAFTGNGTTGFYKYDIPSNTWSTMAVAPGTISAGGALVHPDGSNFIYAFRGRNSSTSAATNEFYRYSISGNSWTNLTSTTPPPDTVQGGGALVALNSTDIYAFAGNDTNKFWKFTISNPGTGEGTWTDLTSTDPVPDKVLSGGSLTTDGTKIYGLKGGNTTTFWQYDPGQIAGSRWSELSSTPVAIGGSASRVLAQGGLIYYQGDIYAIPGNGRGNFAQNSGAGPGLLFRYQLPASSGPAGDDNTWPIFNTLTTLPATLGEGASLTYPGSGNFLYAFRGGTTNSNFWMYDIEANEWKIMYLSKFDDDTRLSQDNSVSGATANQGLGNSIVEVSGVLYVLQGGSAKFQKFNPATNTWTTLSDVPNTVANGGSIVKKDNNTLYVFRGSGSSEFWKYDIPNNAWHSFPLSEKDDGTPFSQAGTAQGSGNTITKLNNPIGGDPEFYVISGNQGAGSTFEKFSPATNTWSTLTSLPSGVASGAALVTVGTDIYAFAGNNSTSFYKYNATNDAWTTLATAPGVVGAGGALAYPGSGDYIYALQGGNQARFWRYSISGNSWSANGVLANTPANVQGGGALAFIGNDLYAFGGNGTTNFWRYDITQSPAGIWDTLSGNAPAEAVYSGGALASDGTYLYATPGNALKSYWRYDPSQSSGSRWIRLENLPAKMGANQTASTQGGLTYCDNCGTGEIWNVPGTGRNGYSIANTDSNAGGLIHRYKIATSSWATERNPTSAPDTINYGGALAYPGTGDLIYAFRGGLSTAFWSYNITTNEWNGFTRSKLDNGTPISQQGASPQNGGNAITQVNGKFYILLGASTTFQSYDPNTNVWDTLPSTPAIVTDGAAITSTDNSTIYVLRGGTSNTTNNFWKYNSIKGEWTTLANTPTAVGSGGAITYPGSGDFLYAFRGNNTNTFWKYQISTNTWNPTTPAIAPGTVQGGGALVSAGGDIYAFRGNNTNEFWKYTVGTDTWSSLTSPIWTSAGTISSGGSLTTDGTDIYAFKGDGDPDVKKYTVSSDTWSNLNNFPVNIGSHNTVGGAKGGLAYISSGPSGGGELYGVSGNGAINANGIGLIFRHPFTGTNANTWPTFAALTAAPSTVSYGGALIGLLNGSNYELYALRGNGTNTFWKYTISDTATGAGTWNSTDPADLASGVNVGSGGALTHDGAGNIYATRGNDTNEVYRYNISGNTWTSTSPNGHSLTLPSPLSGSPLTMGSSAINESRGGIAYHPTLNELYLATGNGVTFSNATLLPGRGLLYRYPFTGINAGTWPLEYIPVAQPSSGKNIGSGAALVSTDADSIFAFRGNNTNEFWRYDISSNSWNHSLTAPPTGTNGTNTVGAGASLTFNGTDTIYATRGSTGSVKTKDFWKYTITNATTGAGTWASLTSLPVLIGTNTSTSGGGIALYGSNIWMIPGYGQSAITESSNNEAGLLYRYDISQDTWPIYNEASDVAEGGTNGAFFGGSDLAISQNGTTIYALQGHATTSRLWQYTIGTDTWTQRAAPPATVQGGGSLVASDADTLYSMRGANTSDINKYTISTNTWVAGPTLPTTAGLSPASTSDDRGEMIYSPVTNDIYATPGNDTSTPFSIYSLDSNPRAYINSITDPNNTPTSTLRAGEPLDVVIQAVDANGSPYTVSSNTDITLSLTTGTGTLGGTLTGTITSGSNQVTISGVTYSKAETGVIIRATDTTVGIPFHTYLTTQDSSSLTFVPGPVSASTSTFSADPTTVVADNTDTSTLTTTLKDGQGNAVSGKTVTVVQIGGSGSATITAVTCASGGTAGVSNTSGEACFTVASSVAETAVFRATDSTDGVTITQQASVTFETTDASQSTFTPSLATVVADGTSTSRLTATLKTVSNIPVSGSTVTVTQTSGSGVTITAVACNGGDTPGVSNDSGQACFDVSTTTAQTAVFEAKDTANSVTITQTTQVVFTPDTASADAPHSTVTAFPTNILADGIETSTITVLLRDANNNPIEGKNIDVTKTAGPGTPSITEINCPNPEPPGSGTGVTNVNGKACFTVTSTTPGTATFTATDVTDSIVLTQTANVTFTAVTVATVINVTSSKANGGYTVGEIIPLQIQFSEAVTVTGTPQLTLETGGSDTVVNYSSGSGTDTLTFTYTVAAGDTSSDLDYVDANSLTLNSGTIKDGFSNDAELTLATPGNANSLSANKNIVIDTTAPTLAVVTEVTPDPTLDTTPDFIFSSDEAGTISYGGSCSSATIAAVDGDNTITFAELALGTYSNCTIKVTDAVGNESDPLGVGSFTIEDCIPDESQQCLGIILSPGLTTFSLETPGDFSFPNLESSLEEQDVFSIQAPGTSYVANLDDVISITDTENSGGFTLQLQASAFQDASSGETIPLTNMYVITQPASTGGTTFEGTDAGVEYPASYSGVKNIQAPLHNVTNGSLTDPDTYINHGSTLNQIVDLMVAPVTVVEGGRIGYFKQRVQYYLKVPAGQPVGNYQITLTFDLIRTAPTP